MTYEGYENYNIMVEVDLPEDTTLLNYAYNQFDTNVTGANVDDGFCSGTSVAQALAFYYNDFSILPKDFRNNYDPSPGDFNWTNNDNVKLVESTGANNIAYEEGSESATKYLEDIYTSLVYGRPVIVRVNRKGESVKAEGQHFITIIGVTNGTTKENLDWADFVMVDSATNDDSYQISTVTNGYYRTKTKTYVSYEPANYRIIAPYFIDPKTHALINNTKTSDIEVYNQYLAVKHPEILANNPNLQPKLSTAQRKEIELAISDMHDSIKYSPTIILPSHIDGYNDTLDTIRTYVNKLDEPITELEKYYYYTFKGTNSQDEANEFSILKNKYDKEVNKIVLNEFTYQGFRYTLYDGPASFQENWNAFKEIAKLQPNLGDVLFRVPRFDFNKISDNFLLELLYSISKNREKIDFKGLYYGDTGIINESMLYRALGIDYTPITTESAASGEGLESDENALPEDSGLSPINPKIQIAKSLAELSKVLAVAEHDPLILDLDNDGFGILKKTEGTNFDLDKNGFAEKINWTSTDGFLCLDLNENGKIDNGGELFGNHTLVGNNKAADGFAALAQYDENADGVIDENDDIYRLIKLWNDNGDGVSEDGEFKTLEEMGVSSIDLTQTVPEQTNYTDATVSGVSSAEMSDGTSRTVADFWFKVSTADTMQIYDGEFDADILALPDVRSFGKMPSLRVAMQLDESGVLKELVANFTASTDSDERAAMIKQILYKMTGAEAISPTSRGSYINAQDLHVLETLLGAKFFEQIAIAA